MDMRNEQDETPLDASRLTPSRTTRETGRYGATGRYGTDGGTRNRDTATLRRHGTRISEREPTPRPSFPLNRQEGRGEPPPCPFLPPAPLYSTRGTGRVSFACLPCAGRSFCTVPPHRHLRLGCRLPACRLPIRRLSSRLSCSPSHRSAYPPRCSTREAGSVRPVVLGDVRFVRRLPALLSLAIVGDIIGGGVCGAAVPFPLAMFISAMLGIGDNRTINDTRMVPFLFFLFLFLALPPLPGSSRLACLI